MSDPLGKYPQNPFEKTLAGKVFTVSWVFALLSLIISIISGIGTGGQDCATLPEPQACEQERKNAKKVAIGSAIAFASFTAILLAFAVFKIKRYVNPDLA